MNFRCCCDDCIIATDDFNRANSTPAIGDLWIVVAGTWSITDQTLQNAGTGLVKCKTVHTSDHVSVSVVVGNSSASQYRIVLSYEDENNYLFSQLTPFTGTGTLKLFSRVAGVNTELATRAISIPADSLVTFTACLNPTTLKFSTTFHNASAALTTTLVAGDFNNTGAVGLAVGNAAATARFDDFRFIKVSPDCDPCGQGGIIDTAQCVTCCGLVDASLEYDVDFGAGGWTDTAFCTRCNDVAGVFTVTDRVIQGIAIGNPYPGCRWTFTDFTWCTYFNLVLRRYVAGSQCYWLLTVDLNAGASGSATASYQQGPEARNAPCFLGSPLTLTKQTDNPGGPCDGALPATITIQSVV